MATAELEVKALAKIDYSAIIAADLEAKVEADCALTIQGIDDKEGYRIADTKRKEYVRLRNQLDKHRKDINEDAKRFIQDNNAAAEHWQKIIAKAEDHVTGLVEHIDSERERIKREAADKVYNARNAKLTAVGITLDRIVVDSLTDEQIDQRVAERIELNRLQKEEAERKAKEEAERQQRLAEEQERNRLEAERLAKERAELDRQRKEQEAERIRQQKADSERLAQERAKIEAEQQAERDRLAAERAKVEHELEQARQERQKLADEQAAKERAERDAKAAEARRIQEEQEEAARVERDRLDRERIEAERPYRQKLAIVARNLRDIDLPKHPKGAAATHERVRKILNDAADLVQIEADCTH